MARLVVPVQDILPGYPSTPLVANSADIVWTPAGAAFVDGAGFKLTGREVLLVKNANVGNQTIAISSVPDEKGRKNDIPAFTLSTGDIAAFRFPVEGWRQADGQLYFAASATDVQFGVLRLPAIS